jgi:hypothetical protein
MRSAILLLVLMMSTTPASADEPKTPPKRPVPCSTAEFRQFDFWLGEWEVFDPSGKPVGQSRIEAILNGCVIAEHWTSGGNPPGAGDGKSFNLYNAQTGQWEQFWVDAQGTRLVLNGGFAGGSMVLSGQQPKPDAKTGVAQRERITWTPNTDGSVRQLWESSLDDGKTWTIAFDGQYRRKAKP